MSLLLLVALLILSDRGGKRRGSIRIRSNIRPETHPPRFPPALPKRRELADSQPSVTERTATCKSSECL